MNNILGKLSQRERRLFGFTLLAAVAVIIYLLSMGALGRIEEMDSLIGSMENELRLYSIEAAKLGPVAEAYKKVATQHSSEWTQAEIHDRLRTEIYRLSMVNVPSEGTLPSSLSGQRLVEIPSFPSGSLDERGEGYREYQLRIRTNPTTIENLAVFMQRLQQSDQLLRVERIDLNRFDPEKSEVVADITVTRTVLGASASDVEESVQAPVAVNLTQNPSFETYDGATQTFESWTAKAAALSPDTDHATEGQQALAAEATEQGAAVFQEVTGVPGETYAFSVDLMFEGAGGVLQVVTGSGAALEGEIAIEPSDEMTRYQVAFTVPGGGEEDDETTEPQTVQMLAPYIGLEPGARLYVDNVVVTERGGE